MNILHASTGSIAVTTTTKFTKAYSAAGYNYKSVITSAAQKLKVDILPFIIHMGTPLYDKPWLADNHYMDYNEWTVYEDYNKVLHIELVKWADVLVIAPLSANTLAKIANGICDNLVTNCARAWDFSKPFIVAPSMNTNMYNHPITKTHIDSIKSWGVKVVDPVVKTLYCGDTGIGAMADVNDIINTIKLC